MDNKEHFPDILSHQAGMKSNRIILENEKLRLEIARSVGPRILGLGFEGGPNLLAELPDYISLRPDGKKYHFYGGHRLWRSPEDDILSYDLEDDPVEILSIENGLKITKRADEVSGIEKSIQVVLPDQRSTVVIIHELKNCKAIPLVFSPWAITQFRTGGTAILPMNNLDTGLQPNQNLTLWPYTELSNSIIKLGRKFLLVNALMDSPFKIGFANPAGWIAYWLENTLFVKYAPYESKDAYPDFGCSSECYCNHQFIELETLGPLQEVKPGDSIKHIEKWELYRAPSRPTTEADVHRFVEQLGLKKL